MQNSCGAICMWRSCKHTHTSVLTERYYNYIQTNKSTDKQMNEQKQKHCRGCIWRGGSCSTNTVTQRILQSYFVQESTFQTTEAFLSRYLRLDFLCASALWHERYNWADRQISLDFVQIECKGSQQACQKARDTSSSSSLGTYLWRGQMSRHI